jgi:cytochrome b involved in lipid metabolism
MPILALGLLVVTVILWWVDRSAPADAHAPRRGVRIAVAVLAVLVALANLVWIVRVGDSGAKSVWSGRVAASTGNGESGSTDDEDDEDGAAGRPSGEPTATPAGGGSSPPYTLAQVAANASPSNCWVVINGNVYDLTAWIDQHPGGAQRIIDLCGTDASAAFQGQHSGQSEPAAELAQFAVGVLQ